MRRRAFLGSTALLIAYGCSSFESEVTPVDDAGIPDSGSDIPEAQASDGAVDGGCIASLGTDPLHCGVCGHSCLGGACVNGRCQAQRIANTPLKPTSIAATSKGVHWITE